MAFLFNSWEVIFFFHFKVSYIILVWRRKKLLAFFLRLCGYFKWINFRRKLNLWLHGRSSKEIDITQMSNHSIIEIFSVFLCSTCKKQGVCNIRHEIKKNIELSFVRLDENRILAFITVQVAIFFE